jgi:hypothetical protein
VRDGMQLDQDGRRPPWAPRCPICNGPSFRYVRMLALDCECLLCGWYFTSALKRAVLMALTREGTAGIRDNGGRR